MISAAKPIIGDDERAAVDRVMLSGMLAQGPEVEAFESEFSALLDGQDCVAVNSGTSALHLAFLAAGIGPGDQVIVPSFSFAATANAVSLTGAEPVFADIDIDTFNLDPRAAEAAITSRTKAIMPVHLYGQPADMTAFRDLADRYGLLLFEDAAQAVGATLHGRPVGTWGIAASFSFYPTKNMTSGEGGMVSTCHTSVAQKVRLLRNQGMARRYANEIIGFNARMTDIHAAIGRVQLTKLDQWTKARRANAAFLNANLCGVVLPKSIDGAAPVFHQYTIRVVDQDRDGFANELAARGVGSGVYYPTPIHRLPSFDLDLNLPNTELAASQVLSLPVHPGLSSAELETIVKVVNDVAGAGR